MHPFLGGPRLGDGGRRQVAGAQPRQARGVDHAETAGLHLRRGRRDARVVQPCVEFGLAHHVRIFVEQMGLGVTRELAGIDALEREVVEIPAQERIELLAAVALFEELQEPRALGVDRGAAAVVRVLQHAGLGRQRLQRGVDLGVFLLQLVALDHVLHHRLVFAVQHFDDAILDVAGETFVQPRVLGAGEGDEVARPAVREFVRDQRDQGLVADDHRRGEEGQARILHAAVRERRRQHQHVVAVPAIGAVQAFGGGDHLFGVFELGHGLVEHGRLGPHAAAVGDALERQVARGDRHQVGRDLLRHLEGVVAVPDGIGIVVGAHQHHHVRTRGHVRAVGVAHARRVLQRHPRPRVDLLRLAEHEGQLLALGHRRLQPLQAGRLRRGGVGHPHLGIALRGVDAELAAQHRVGRGQRVFQGRPRAVGIGTFDLGDGQVAAVQHQRGGGAVLPVQLIGGDTGQGPGVEVDLQAQGQILDDDLVRLGIGMFVDHRRRRCRGLGCGRGRGRIFGCAGSHHQGGEQGQSQDRSTHGIGLAGKAVSVPGTARMRAGRRRAGDRDGCPRPGADFVNRPHTATIRPHGSPPTGFAATIHRSSPSVIHTRLPHTQPQGTD